MWHMPAFFHYRPKPIQLHCQNGQVLNVESNLKFPSESLYIIMEVVSLVHKSLTLHDTKRRNLKAQDI